MVTTLNQEFVHRVSKGDFIFHQQNAAGPDEAGAGLCCRSLLRDRLFIPAADRRNVQSEGGAGALLALHGNIAADLPDDAVHGAQSEPPTLADALRLKQRLEK